MTRDTIMAHIRFMAKFEPAYARSALHWYHSRLPWLGLLPAGEDQPNR